ncbi:hypothetical protein FRB95_000708 [Tulasnella sp. JGI-2019a]|nr:hypothetical protein FRB95_000708 [Tulasnella sp. JGI-2019a]
MRFHLTFVPAVFCASHAVAIRIPLSRSAASSHSLHSRAVGMDLLDSHDVVYMANVSIGGVVYPLQLDTGSSDLWVRPPGGSLSNASPTSLTYNITYSIGYAAGNIVTAPVAFAGTSVSAQALLDVTSSNNPIFQYGAAGILGLGFTSLSNINKTVSASGSTTNGNAYLANIFGQNTSQPNFIAFALERNNGLSTDLESSFSIGEVDSTYAGITQTQAISTWPVSEPSRWTLLVDGYEYADGIKRTMSTTVANAPGAVLLLDTGASYAYGPPDVVNGLYSGISGATFDSSSSTWSVPCDQEVNFALWIAGRKFDWHPLDVVVPSVSNNATCYGSIQPSTTLNGFDFHGGDVFLRSLYTILDFGDYTSGGTLGDPYIRLWSLIDQPTASAEFHKIRGGTTQPYQSSSSASPNAASSQPNVPANADASTTSVSADQELIQHMNTLVTYAPIALGVLGLNAVLLLVLCGFAVVFMCRRKKGKKPQAINSFARPTLGRQHSYQQVKGDAEDAETPLTKTKFSHLDSLRMSTAPSYHEMMRPGEYSASYQMGQLGKEAGPSTPVRASIHDRKGSTVTTPGTATFRPSNLSNVTTSPPEPSPIKTGAGVGQDLLLPSPSRSAAALPSPEIPAEPSGSHSSHSHHSETRAPPPGPSLSQVALSAEQDGSARQNTEGPEELLQPPTRRFKGAQLQDTSRRTNSLYDQEGGGERGTVYFDAADNQSDGVRSPSYAQQGGPSSPISPFNARSAINADGHSRSGSNASIPSRSPVPSPSRAAFPAQPRSLAPSSLGPSRLAASGDGNSGHGLSPSHARLGSYASVGARTPSNLGPQQGMLPSHGDQNPMQQGEEDLTDQMRRPSFDGEPGVDAFADS